MGAGKGRQKRMNLVRQRDLNKWIKENGKYMYHITTMDHVATILKEGIIPWDDDANPSDQSNYDDWFQTRPGHVYVGDYEAVSIYDKIPPILQIDLTKLDKQNVNPDEDHWVFRKINNMQPAAYFENGELPSQGAWDNYWLHDMGKWAPPTLGEWAEEEGLGNNKDETKFSLSQGSIGYRGTIPANCISINKECLDYTKWNEWNSHRYNFKSQEELALFLEEYDLRELADQTREIIIEKD